jgi:hypothetical protein
MTSKQATAKQPSRLSQLLRHCEKALRNRCGLPKWKVEAKSPPTASAKAKA